MTATRNRSTRPAGQGTILVVDDEQDILELISYNLRREGFEVVTVTGGEEALEAIAETTPSAVVLDLMLPDVDGLEVCKRLKQDEATRQLPVVMLTARTEEADIVTGLEVGADDYVTKPFSPKVLIARLRAVMRRAEETGAARDSALQIRIHDIVIDPARHEVFAEGERIDLSATEFAILEFFARNPGWVFTRHKIIDAVRGKDYPVTERAVDVQVLGIRRKLGRHGKLIQTVRGVGYRLQAD